MLNITNREDAMADAELMTVPEHVPSALVRDFPLEFLPGMTSDPVNAVNEAANDAADIFHGRNERQPRRAA
jgi:hypothetical protein